MPNQSMADPRETRRVYGGSVYWLRRRGYIPGAEWIVTGDEVPLCAPTSYEAALRVLEDVAPEAAARKDPDPELRAQREAANLRRRLARRERDDAMRSLGLHKVRGARGGTYWE